MDQCYFCFITSEKGFTCQNWTSNQPHQPNYLMMYWLYSKGDNLNDNFCRIADPSDPRPWCYTTNPNVRFDYCDCNPHGPICQHNAGTITMPFSFEFTKYEDNASILSRPRSNGSTDTDRVFGGQDATPGEVPWQVNLLFDGNRLDNLRCGGTLVSTTVRLICNKVFRLA